MKHATAFLGLLTLLLAASGLLVSCGNNNNNDDSAPDDISGTWVGTVAGGGETRGLTVVINQSGSNLAIQVTVEGEGTYSGNGTYENGIATVSWESWAVDLQISGNKMTGAAAGFSVELTKQ